MEEQIVEKSGVPPEEPVEAPPKKRQLTEAQRLAFLKGREKRMLNIQKKREEKEEAERLKKEEEQPLLAEAPKEPELKKVKIETPTREPTDDSTAEKIANYVYLKLMSDLPPVPPQRKPRKPRKPKTPTIATPVQSSPQPPPPAPPQKVISWC